jgi:ABC-type dipeptide/oligopeptide/nickel transport system ATPase component
MITHDLGVVAEIADDVVVMYAARIVERGNVDAIFNRPRHPYTWGLLGSTPTSSVWSRSRASRRPCCVRRAAAGSTRAART